MFTSPMKATNKLHVLAKNETDLAKKKKVTNWKIRISKLKARK